MSIQKITQSEILANGIKGLSTRPSTPSLYKGNVLSAEELKDAFDKLPTLIADRFNALLEATGLYDPACQVDLLSALIATDLAPSHSLLNFFEDVKNGNLSMYLTAGDDGEPLADVLSELRAAIEALKSFTLTVEGDGDLVSDAEIDDKQIKIIRSAKTEDILNQAKAYTDAPVGTVDPECETPVSGKNVFNAIKESAEMQLERIENLENAAKDILYTYPTKDVVFKYRRVEKNALLYAALLKLGATPLERYNRFAEEMLFDFQTEDLSITWDEEEKVVVINGTLHPTEEPIRVTVFRQQLFGTQYFASGIFYRGGSVSTENASLVFRSSSDALYSLPFLNGDSVSTSCRFIKGPQFYSLELSATEDTVFENYRCNLVVSHEQAALHYEPACSKNRYVIPKKLVCIGPNIWSGPDTITGETYVSFTPPYFPNSGCYIFGFALHSDAPSEIMAIHFFTEDGFYDEDICKKGSFQNLVYFFEKPVTEIRIYAAKTPEASQGYKLEARDIYIEPIDLDYEKELPYSTYYRDEIVFPDSFQRFFERYMGYSDRRYNCFDFELGGFVDGFETIHIDSTLEFEAENAEEGCFSAPYPVPAILQEGSMYYMPSYHFYNATLGKNNETIWFTEERIVVKSENFIGKDADYVKRFFTACPIDVVYMRSDSTVTPLSEEEKAFWEAQTLKVKPNAYLYFADADGNPVSGFAQIQYQMKQAPEETA